MQGTQTVVVQASAAMLVVLLTAPLVGLFFVLVRMLARSGRIGMSFSVLREARADVVTLVAYDVGGGILCALGILLLGITRPPFLVSGFQTTPVLAWAVVGSLGPLVSVGVLDHLPLRGLTGVVAGAERPEKGERAATMLADVRFQASQRILSRLYEEVAVCDGIERDGQRMRARVLIEGGQMHFDDLADAIRRFAHEWDDGLPKQVEAALKSRPHWPTDQDPGSETLRLLEVTIMAGLADAVKIACRIAEART